MKREYNRSKHEKTVKITQQIQMAVRMEKLEKRLKRTAMWISNTCQPKCFSKFIFLVCKV